jgi:hypothetical protein
MLTPKTKNRAEMDLRTGSGRYKRVMWFQDRQGYGNDLADMPMDVWKESFAEDLEAFFGHLIPS